MSEPQQDTFVIPRYEAQGETIGLISERVTELTTVIANFSVALSDLAQMVEMLRLDSEAHR